MTSLKKHPSFKKATKNPLKNIVAIWARADLGAENAQWFTAPLGLRKKKMTAVIKNESRVLQNEKKGVSNCGIAGNKKGIFKVKSAQVM